MNKMAGRTPGAQETWQETPSHSVLHNYASTLPWIDIYTANTAFPLPARTPPTLLPLASIRAQNRPRARRWKANPANSIAVAFSGDGFRWRWNCKARGTGNRLERRRSLESEGRGRKEGNPYMYSDGLLYPIPGRDKCSLPMPTPFHNLPYPPTPLIPFYTSPIYPYPDPPV